MPWKDELISSKTEAYDFLCRHVAAAGLPPFVIADRAVENETYASPEILLEDAPSEEAAYVGFFDLRGGRGPNCSLESFQIIEEFRGRGFGALAAKAVLAIAHELSVTHIKLFFVNNNGPSFWPSLGAIPAAMPVGLGRDIKSAVERAAKKLTEHDRRILTGIGSLAEENPYWGWRLLSQAEGLSKEGKAARHKAFTGTCFEKNLFLIPSEPGTRAILSKKLGILPAFRSLPANDPFMPAMRALSTLNPACFALDL